MRVSKMFSLASILGLMLSACAASAASADEVTAESYPASITGSADTEAGTFVTTAGTVSCTNTKYKATLSGQTTTIVAQLDFSSTTCTAFGFPATVETNECSFLYTLQGGASTSGDVDLQCPTGKALTVKATAGGTIKCTLEMKTQNDLEGSVAATNVGAGATREVTLVGNMSGIDYTHTKGSGLGACSSGSSTSGSIQARTIVTAENGAGSHVGIFLS